MEEQRLRMSFDPNTIEHLGVKMYSNIPNAIAELIANAYDADAKNVAIRLIDEGENKSIQVEDDGHGMDFEDINNKFLRIGRKRRIEGNVSPTGRKVTGKKGLGKLAFFGIGNTIEITTIKEGTGKEITFKLDWDELISVHDKDYEPIFETTDCDANLKGTKITLTNLKRKSAFDKEQLAISLSKLFNLFDNNFRVIITLNNDNPIHVDEKLKYNSIEQQFNWEFPDFLKNVGTDYSEKNNIQGEILSTEKPLKPGLRGVTLFANGRLINAPEFFGVSESSHGFSYLTGWLNVNFIDDWVDDVISTDRQSLNWDLPRTTELREFLKKTMAEIERKWRERRHEEKKKRLKERTSVDIPKWYSTLPKEVLNKVESVVNTIIDKSELEDEAQTQVIQNLHNLVPDYPYYHWRHLHPKIKAISEQYYNNTNYYTAFAESVKKYISEVKTKARSNNSCERSLMGEVFSGRKLMVTSRYKKKDGTGFSSNTIKNIEEGQHYLSEGVVIGCRHPIAHEEFSELKDSGLFSEIDCLDALSLLSHLFRRLDDAVTNTP